MPAFKLRTYLIIAFSLLTFTLTLSAILLLSRQVDQYGQKVMAMYGETLARDLAFSAADHLIVQEYGQLSDLIAEFSQRPDLGHISIIGVDGIILSDLQKEFLGKDVDTVYPNFLYNEFLEVIFAENMKSMNVYAPIHVFDRLYGYASVTVLLDSQIALQQQIKKKGGMGGLLFWLVSLFGVIAISRKITKPVSQMLLSANRISDGDFSKPVPITGPEEIQHFAGAFNTMAEIIGERETRLRTILDSIPDAVFLADREMKVLWANKKAQEISMGSIGAPCHTVFWASEQPCENCPCHEVLEKGKVIEATFQSPVTENEQSKCLEISAVPLFDTIGKVNGFVEIARDVSARLQAEEEKAMLMEQLLQAQKMESIGRLAGGVAHDFNNILSAINGYAEICLLKMEEDNPFREKIRIILESGKRATRLTQQLLAFSRKQIIKPELLDLNRAIDDTRKMLERLLGEDIEIKIIQDEALWPVKADRSQLEQVVLNLTINARDAMPLGGNLTIETANIMLEKKSVKDHYIISHGDHVMLTISDTGQGMSRETREHIFEPFFTTKEQDKGTGLGLATVYGIIKQNSGEIMVYSEQGRGSTFKIYLPRAEEVIETQETGPIDENTGVNRGTETILLVEDDEIVRRMSVDILTGLGYTVLDAENGENALLLYSHYQSNIDLLLTDVVMPKMSGTKLASTVKAQWPKTKVLFMSGYTENAIINYGVTTDHINFIHKPFSPQSLSRAVRTVLD
ncbi:MAG: response regulator [Proteobacteria bacterium]|nr:response regulator [Pseudomonadota bacterium]MBU1058264.1 response regulator [Pseudomonadota bacterium]